MLVRYLKDCIDNLKVQLSAEVLFPKIPVIKFEPEHRECPDCKQTLKVFKTQTKAAVTMEIGKFTIHETIKYCESCSNIYSPKKPNKLVPRLCKYGYNVLVYIGMALFVEFSNEKQIQKELKKHNISISIREIGYLGKKFIIYLALAHKESRTQLKKLFCSRGGYILHLDGTCEGGMPLLMTALDEIAKIVLDNVKVPSEKAEKIIPFLRQIKQAYGMPAALVHDMGKGILSAVKEVFSGIPDYICHYHFLRDIGAGLLGSDYSRIRNGLRKNSIRYSLRTITNILKKKIEIEPEQMECFNSYLNSKDKKRVMIPSVQAYILTHWILDANSESNGYGFPFDRPYYIFLKRLQIVRSVIADLSTDKKNDKYISRLYTVLRRILKDESLKKAMLRMEEKAEIFDQLRAAMRIACPNGKDGLNDDGSTNDMKTIKDAVTAFRNSKQVKVLVEKDMDYKKMVQQIDRYREKLFADPLILTTPDGKEIQVQPQRTNNIMERFFREMKRNYRSKSGTKSLNKTIKAMLADTPLVKNLSNPEYMNIILDGNETLEERFALIDEKLVREELKKNNSKNNKIPARLKKLLRIPDLPLKINKAPKKIWAT